MARTRLDLKYTFDCDAKNLFLALTTPEYMQNWLAERVVKDDETGVYTFYWRDFAESAVIEIQKPKQYLKWKWIASDREKDDFIEFRIDTIAGDDLLDLYITDFCDQGEEKQVRKGWDKQMQKLESVVR